MPHQPSCVRYQDARTLIYELESAGFAARFAGGCVRDRLLNISPKDYDIATTASPQDIERVAAQCHRKTIPTGISHGTITVLTSSGACEVTTLRRDVRTDGRHAIVDFSHATFEDDAARRDFTINAMFEDANGVVYDYFGGQNDLKLKKLQFVGDARTRIQEDYLRILRLFRFWSRFEFTPTTQTLEAAAQNVAGLANISQERITQELWQILQGPAAATALHGMQDTQILRWILPESVPVDHGISLMMMDASQEYQLETRQWLQLILLLGITKRREWTSDAIHTFSRRLKWSDRDYRTLSMIFWGWEYLRHFQRTHANAMHFVDTIEHSSTDLSMNAFYSPIWYFCAGHVNDSARTEALGWILAIEASYGEMRRMPLPISGKDVTQLRPDLIGPAIGETLASLRSSFRNGVWRTRKEGLALLMQVSKPKS